MQVNNDNLEKLDILIVEDSPTDTEFYKRMLGQISGKTKFIYNVIETETGAEGLDLLDEQRVDCVLLDYNLPDFTGLEFLDELNKSGQKNISVVMLTGQGNESIAAQSFKKGAQDYIVKEHLTIQGLQRSVNNAVEKNRLENEIIEQHEKIKQQNQELQKFAYIASHDLKEPLRKIHTFSNMLKKRCDDKLDETENKYIDSMQKASERMGALIDGLLQLSRIEADDIDFKKLDLNSAVQSVLEDLEIAIQENEVEIKVAPLKKINANELQIRQLFQNLISNAIKFNSSQIDISGTKKGKMFQITISDNGIGFDPKNNDRIFLTFEKLNPKNLFEGTGIGLSICKQIMEKHKGKISAIGKPGEGAIFKMDFPLLP
ncbi:MAG: hybrid sensor histidine kinase/response regulator [Calditrichaeota bacterium]|nr:MAG: hybrid sensor histidine kinase/response regulator [Calditrichota bacterium]MBL1206659.1 hybrid sensor histidine kinase/response regulator [Calditrichota bacterium]NOG46486.1 response regulator [Calditrichota bacterium]